MLRRARNRGQVRSAGTCCQLLVDLGALEYGVTTHVSSSLVDFAEDAGEVVAASPKVSTMRIALCGTTALGLAAFAAIAAASAPFEQPLLREIAVAPDPAQLQATVQALVGFGTRHTLSDTTSPKRGIGAAQQQVGIVAILREHRDADAEADARGVPVPAKVERCLHRL